MSYYPRKSYLATGRKIPSGWHVHHIVPKCEGGADDASNLIAVHPTMHQWVHEMRGDKRSASGVYNMRNGHSDATKLKMRTAKLGKKQTEEHAAKSRGVPINVGKDNAMAMARWQRTCPHCDVTMDKGNYTKHHGDSCKHKGDT